MNSQPSLDELIAQKSAEFLAAGFSEEEIRAALELLLSAQDEETNADARGVLGEAANPTNPKGFQNP